MSGTDDSEIERKYLEEISGIPPLTEREEIELIEKIKQGDNSSRDKLIKANLRFVRSVALKYCNKDVSLSDLISEGNFGLFHALEKFDSTKGFRFLTYAGSWVTKYILNAVNEGNNIGEIPLAKLKLLEKVKDANANSEWLPSLKEIAELLHVSEKEVLEVIEIRNERKSFDFLEETRDNELLPLYDLLGDKSPNRDYSIIQEEESERLRLSLSHLSPNQKKVIELNFGLNGKEPLNLQQISQELNISGERVRQLREAGMKNLKKEIFL